MRTGSGTRGVTVLDLSESGCHFHDRSGHWREGDQIGIRFVQPLYQPVLDHIRAHFDLRRR